LVARHGIADPGGYVELPELDPSWRPPAPISPAELLAVWRETAVLLARERAGAEWQARLAVRLARAASRCVAWRTHAAQA
jgi:hypothetical protein